LAQGLQQPFGKYGYAAMFALFQVNGCNQDLQAFQVGLAAAGGI
jgi:hypothetical protein